MERDPLEERLLEATWQNITGGEPWIAKRGAEYLARATGLKRRKINELVAAGDLPGVNIGRNIMLRPHEFLRWWRGGGDAVSKQMSTEDVIRRV